MTFRVVIKLLSAVALLGSAIAGPAQALNRYSYLAATTPPMGTGDCSSPANACSSLTAAHSNTADGGVITCISGGVTAAPVSITKSITIDCAATGHVVSSLVIDAAGKSVKMTGLTINGAGSDTPMLTITAAASVVVENGSIGNPQAAGGQCIRDNRAGPAKLLIKDSSIYDCPGVGILILPASGNLSTTIDRVKVWNCGYGLAVGRGGRVMIARSTFSGNGTAGVEADGGAFIALDDSFITHNDTGIITGGLIAISNTEINSNNTPISGPGLTQSYGNNRIFANVLPGTAPTPAGSVSNEAGQR